MKENVSWIKDGILKLSDGTTVTDPNQLEAYELDSIFITDKNFRAITFKSGSFNEVISKDRKEVISLRNMIERIRNDIKNFIGVISDEEELKSALVVIGKASKAPLKRSNRHKLSFLNFQNLICYGWEPNILYKVQLDVTEKSFSNEHLPAMRSIQTSRYIKDTFRDDKDIEGIDSRVFPLCGALRGKDGEDREHDRKIDFYIILKPKEFKGV